MASLNRPTMGGIIGTFIIGKSCSAAGYTGDCSKFMSLRCPMGGGPHDLTTAFGTAIQSLARKAPAITQQVYQNTSAKPTQLFDKGNVCAAVARSDTWFSEGDGGWFNLYDYCR